MYKMFLINSMEKSGGTERVVANLSNMWAKKDDIEIIIVGKSNKSFYDLSSNIKITCLNIKSYNRNPLSVLLWLFQITIKIYCLLKMKKPDVILGIWTSMAICATIAGRLAGIKSIACEHISYDLTKKSLKILRKIIYPFADCVVTLTERDKEKFMKYCNSVKCIENQISFFQDEYPNYSAKIVLAVGRLVEQKGFDLLLESWYKVIQTNSDWKLIIVGGKTESDSFYKKMMSIINECNLTKYVRIEPPTNNIIKHFMEASIFVVSSRYEGLPMVMIEAMAVGLPIISFDCPTGPKEIVQNEVTGFLVKPLDIEELAVKINFLIQKEEYRKNFGKKAKNIALLKYSPEVILEKWDKLFASI